MARNVLALIEDTIGTKLLLASRLKGLGYEITILSAAVAFRERVAADSFDWIILDEAALPPARRRFLSHLQRHRKEARIVWCGKALRRPGVPIEATFGKPMRYDEIERFFLHRASPDLRGLSISEGGQPRTAADKPKMPAHFAEGQGPEAPGEGAAVKRLSKGDGKP